MPSTQLTYYLFEGILTGEANGRFVHISAHSGGGSGRAPGRTPHPAHGDDRHAMNSPYHTGQKMDRHKGVRGGPLPLGRYRIEAPERSRGYLAAALHPMAGNAAFARATGGRSGFLIHGRGTIGSDGCIVPTDPVALHNLMDALTASQGGMLTVLESTCDHRFA